MYPIIRKVLVLLLLFGLFSSPAKAAVTRDIDSTSEWNIRIDGETSGAYIGYYVFDSADVNADGEKDIIIGSAYADNNGRADSGSIWIIYSTHFDSFTGRGNVIDLSDTSTWDIRIDGAVAGDYLGGYYASSIVVDDLDGDGKDDIVVADNDFDVGNVYILYNTLLDDFTGTGNTVDLASSSNYNIKMSGVGSDYWFGVGRMDIGDIDNDGLNDLLIPGWTTTEGSVYMISNTIFSGYSGTGNTFSMSDSSKYSIRYDGATLDSAFGESGTLLSDINNNGKLDIVIASRYADQNSRANSGSLYVIMDSLIDDYSGTGNIVSMNTATNFNHRYDGAAAGDFLGDKYGFDAKTGDLNGDSLKEIAIASERSSSNAGALWILDGALMDNSTGNTYDLATSTSYLLRIEGLAADEYLTCYEGECVDIADVNNDGLNDIGIISDYGNGDTGEVYIIYNDILSANLSGTGNTLDLSNSSSYSIYYKNTGNNYPSGALRFQDLNGDGSQDIFIGAPYRGGGLSNSGSGIIIYNFPHTITTSSKISSSNATLTGTITATDSVTTIIDVQYSLNSNSQSGTWNSCTPGDGTFNSRSESYTCYLTGLANGSHTIYVRAKDSNGVYTAQSSYAERSVSVGSSSTPRTAQISIDAIKKSGGTFFPTGDSEVGKQNISVQIQAQTFDFNAFVSAKKSHPSKILEVAQSNGIETHNKNTIQAGDYIGVETRRGVSWQIGEIQELWYKAYSPGFEVQGAAKIIPELQERVSNIGISYTDQDLIPPGQPDSRFLPSQLRLAHSIDGVTWTVLENSVVDPVNKTVAVLDKVGGYYMIVALPTTRNTTSVSSPELRDEARDIQVEDSDPQETDETKADSGKEAASDSNNTPEKKTIFSRVRNFFKGLFD